MELIAQYPLLAAMLALVGLGAVFGAVLGFAAVRFRTEGNPIVEQINELLPQTQCGQCGFAGCRPYAEAIAAGEADINQCPPGGENTIQALADLLGVDVKPLNEEHGMHAEKAVAVIDENTCIGCTLCIQACPVDAIIGAPRLMHTVIEAECTGCDLCLPPCPVDCIEMVVKSPSIDQLAWPRPAGRPHEPEPLRAGASGAGAS